MENCRRLPRERLRRLPGRQLLLALAFVALLGAGGLELLPRSGTSSPASAGSSGAAGPTLARAGAPAAGAERPAPSDPPAVRAAPVATSSVAPQSVDGPPPGSRPGLAQHLAAHPLSRGPDDAPTDGFAVGWDSRGPPPAAGTDASLPLRP